jgi:hypothetical protein
MGISQSPQGIAVTTSEEVLIDPVQKMRISSPQALIDTDFEYGTQISKWENLTMTNNRPFAFNRQTPVETITAITQNTGSRTVTVSLTSTTGLAVGSIIVVQDTLLAIANGGFLIEALTTNTSFTYTANAVNTTSVTSIFDTNKTLIYQGSVYSGSAIGGAPVITYSGTAITATTTVPHGLSLGNEVALTGITTSGANPPNGSFYVARIISSTQFMYYTLVAPTGTLTTTSALIYPHSQGQFLHRPFDGGVIFTSNGTSNFESAIRQTRRYFRYQSGKGVQMSSGTLLKPGLQLDALSYNSGTGLVTVQTKERHGIQPGSTINVYGANEPGFNGSFVLYTVTGYNTFTYVPSVAPTAALASGTYYITITDWFGCANRIGLFDQQNGVFFEYDGQTLSAVRRSSTFQIAGKSSVTNGSATISQTSTAFATYYSKQLNIGDYVVIRGQSYRITDIQSDTQMTISPAYRGATSTMVIVSKTIDTKFPQSLWNLDKMDGTGASGYNIDLSRMQMFYIDYSWYGAGSIRWGLRGVDGKVTYCHKIANNNTNTEAYMRSGNLPARYETTTQPPYTFATAGIGAADTSISVSSTAGFPNAGTLCINNNTYGWEFVNYTGKTATTFTGLTRARAGNASLALTVAAGNNVCTVASTANLQVGQRINAVEVPEGTFIARINSATQLELSQAVTAANPTVQAIEMGTGGAITYTYSATNPIEVELAFPTYSPSISHWGTSVIMDGRYDDDKSLLFTYGSSAAVTVAGNTSVVLLGIRVAPSVDNGTAAQFGQRELINRMQLILRALDVTTSTSAVNLLITAVLNGTPTVARTWTSPAVGTSSLAQVADYAGQVANITGGETTGGFFVNTTTSIDLSTVRDLGNSILGGGGTISTTGIYPDGPDTLHIICRNLTGTSASVFARLSWTEAQA